MNYISRGMLGRGAKIYAALPADKVADAKLGFTDSGELKATYFVYPKGADLYPGFTQSPAFRIAWPVFGFVYGKDPSCEEFETVPCPSCRKACKSRDDMVNAIQSGKNPTPLTKMAFVCWRCPSSG